MRPYGVRRFFVLALTLVLTGLLGACTTLEIGVEPRPEAATNIIVAAPGALATAEAENGSLTTRVAGLEAELATTEAGLRQASAAATSGAAVTATQAAAKTATIAPTATRKTGGLTTPIPSRPAQSGTPANCRTAGTQSELAVLAANPELVCPLEAEAIVPMARQMFQYGQMLWRSDEATVYVLENGGNWTPYADTWVDGDVVDDPTLVSPAGLEQPVRGFGLVWRSDLGGPKAAIGWATAAEAGLTGAVQRWQGGIVVRFGGETLVMIDKGPWRTGQ